MRRWLLHHARTGFSDAGMLAPTIVFDLDGTLINTAPDLIDTLNAVFARDGFPPVPYETARNLIGDGAKGMIARDLAAEGHDVTAAKLQQMFADFIAHYSAHIADRSRPFPDLIEVLDELAGFGYRFAVCTNKLKRLSVLLLETLALADRFEANLRAGYVRHPETRSRDPAAH